MECPFGSSTVDVVLGHLSDLEILPRSVYNLFWSFPKLVGGLKYFEISQSDFLGDPSTYFFLYLVGGDWNHGMDYDFPETLGNGIIIPADELKFLREVGIPPTRFLPPIYGDNPLAQLYIVIQLYLYIYIYCIM